MLNNPANTVTFTAEHDLIVHTVFGCISIKAGEEVSLPKSVYAQCVDPTLLKAKDHCPDITWLITIPPGEPWKAEVPKTADGLGTPASLCVDSCECLLYSFGTEVSPLEIPEGAEIKENAPTLVQPGLTSYSLNTAEGPINAVAFVNPNSEPVAVSLTWKGCLK